MKSRVDMNKIFNESALKNKSYSKVADSVKNIFDAWLASSFLSEKRFLDSMNNDFSLNYFEDSEKIECSLLSAGVPIGLPFICGENSDKNNYKTDLFLLLLYIGNKVGGKAKEVIDDFVNRNVKLLDK